MKNKWEVVVSSKNDLVNIAVLVLSNFFSDANSKLFQTAQTDNFLPFFSYETYNFRMYSYSCY